MVGFPADNGGRRLGIERRTYSYNGHMPERRSGIERRSGKDRRSGVRLGPAFRRKSP